jgi:hypothetical protein
MRENLVTYLVTLDPDTEHAVSKIVKDEDIHRVLRSAFPPYGDLKDGEAIQIRRADYLDTKVDNGVSSERPKLTLLRGGIEW